MPKMLVQTDLVNHPDLNISPICAIFCTNHTNGTSTRRDEAELREKRFSKYTGIATFIRLFKFHSRFTIRTS